MPARIPIDHNAIADLCRRHNVRRLALYGSVLREDFDPDRSDVDVLIDFEHGADRSLFVIADVQDELTKLFGRPVQVCTTGSLSRYFRDQVLAEAEEQYVAA